MTHIEDFLTQPFSCHALVGRRFIKVDVAGSSSTTWELTQSQTSSRCLWICVTNRVSHLINIFKIKCTLLKMLVSQCNI